MNNVLANLLRKNQRTDTVFTVKEWPILLDHYRFYVLG